MDALKREKICGTSRRKTFDIKKTFSGHGITKTIYLCNFEQRSLSRLVFFFRRTFTTALNIRYDIGRMQTIIGLSSYDIA